MEEHIKKKTNGSKKAPRIKKETTIEQGEDLQAIITHHPNGLIVIQLNQRLQSIFLSAEEACAIAKALLLEARRVRIAKCNSSP